ncbi:unnamed protein product, partial [Leptidea sinapis]
RFRQQFKKLSSFYKHASSLQYYRNLLTLPVLPSNPPNFLLQSDFGTYVTPVVSIPELPPDEVDTVGSLIDTSDTMSQVIPERSDSLDTRTTPSPVPDPILERDKLIEHLQNELRRMRSDVSQIVQERNTMLGSMREHSTRIEAQLQATKNELVEERQKADTLAVEIPVIQKRLKETEEKAKVTDDKFQKLKGAYTQLREEHINLIRQKAEVDKLTTSLRAAAAQHESAKTMLQQQLNDQMKDVELLQQKASSSEEVEAYKTELLNLRSDLEQSRQKEVELETLKASMEALQIEQKTTTAEQEEKISFITNELKELSENFERIKKEKAERDEEIAKVKDELNSVRDKSGEEYKKVCEEKDTALKQLSELTIKYQQEKEAHTHHTNNLDSEIELLTKKLNDAEVSLQNECRHTSELLKDKRSEYQNSLNKKALEIKEYVDQITAFKDKLVNSTTTYENAILCKDQEINKLRIDIEEIQKETELSTSSLQLELESKKSELEKVLSDKLRIDNLLSEERSKVIDFQSKLEDAKREKVEELSRLQTKIEAMAAEYKSELNEKLNLNFMLDTLKTDKQVLQNEIERLTSERIELGNKIETIITEKNKMENDLKYEMYELKIEHDKYKTEKDKEVKYLSIKLNDLEIDSQRERIEKANVIEEFKKEIEMFKSNLLLLKKKSLDEKEKLERAVDEKINEVQLLEARLEHTEEGRLNAECELQDLLQQNTVLEADLATLKIQLEEAQNEIKKQSSKILSCAGEAALEVTNSAILNLENSNTQDANKLAAELAAKAFEELSRNSQVEGAEDILAKSAIFAAHNTAQLSAYAAEVTNLSTDAQLVDKINNECRNMLSTTRQCLESLQGGAVDRGLYAAVLSTVR